MPLELNSRLRLMMNPQSPERTVRRVLIVEDEWLIGEDLKGDLEGRGLVVLGPAMSCADALAILREDTPDLCC